MTLSTPFDGDSTVEITSKYRFIFLFCSSELQLDCCLLCKQSKHAAFHWVSDHVDLCCCEAWDVCFFGNDKYILLHVALLSKAKWVWRLEDDFIIFLCSCNYNSFQCHKRQSLSFAIDWFWWTIFRRKLSQRQRVGGLVCSGCCWGSRKSLRCRREPQQHRLRFIIVFLFAYLCTWQISACPVNKKQTKGVNKNRVQI